MTLTCETMIRYVSLCLCLIVWASSEAQTVEPPPKLLVVNQGDANLSLVDTQKGRQVAAVPEGVLEMVGHEVATSPDGRFAYLPLYGDSGVGKPGSNGDLILIIDLSTRKIVDRIAFDHGVRPHCVVYDRGSGMLYVTSELDKTVTIIDPRLRKIVGSIPTEQEQSHMLAISHDGRRGYTANVGPGTVSVLNLETRKFIKTIPISAMTQRISISNDDRLVFTADQMQPRLAEIDTASNAVRSWIALPSLGYGSAPSPDGRTLLITLPGAGALAEIDLIAQKVVRTIQIGPRPQEVVISPDGTMAYVSCFGGHQVAAVDLAKWRIASLIDVGEKADGMAWIGQDR